MSSHHGRNVTTGDVGITASVGTFLTEVVQLCHNASTLTVLPNNATTTAWNSALRVLGYVPRTSTVQRSHVVRRSPHCSAHSVQAPSIHCVCLCVWVCVAFVDVAASELPVTMSNFTAALLAQQQTEGQIVANIQEFTKPGGQAMSLIDRYAVAPAHEQAALNATFSNISSMYEHQIAMQVKQAHNVYLQMVNFEDGTAAGAVSAGAVKTALSTIASNCGCVEKHVTKLDPGVQTSFLPEDATDRTSLSPCPPLRSQLPSGIRSSNATLQYDLRMLAGCKTQSCRSNFTDAVATVKHALARQFDELYFCNRMEAPRNSLIHTMSQLGALYGEVLAQKVNLIASYGQPAAHHLAAIHIDNALLARVFVQATNEAANVVLPDFLGMKKEGCAELCRSWVS